MMGDDSPGGRSGTGCMAVAVVVLLFAGAAGIVAVVAVNNRPQTSVPAAASRDSPTADIRSHPFWKQRPSEADLDRIVAMLTDPDAYGLVLVDENGRSWHEASRFTGSGRRDTIRYVVIGVGHDGSVFKTRAEALAALKDRLDDIVKSERYEGKFRE